MGKSPRSRTPQALHAVLALALAGGFVSCASEDGFDQTAPRATSPPPRIDASPNSSPAHEPFSSPTTRSPTPAPSPSASEVPDEYELPSELVAVEWYALPTDARIVALTFDCGANADGIPAIPDTLARKKAPASFFLTGRWAETFQSQAASIGTRFAVGNHTYDHPDLTQLERPEIRRELLKAGRRIVRYTGVDPHPLFRFPFGASDARTLRIVNRLGYGSIRWTIDSLGWKGEDAGITTRSIVKRVMAGLRPGAILLMHVGSAPDGSTLDADALPRLIRKIRQAGYRLVRLDRFISSLSEEDAG